ncbi:alpha/beta fold hydrolase [Ruegeria sp. EL01]|uniref:alpha/beta fold hydrolase n=1 Tax=Ruegeria sp. EL01 TaxID=2107578 RepID=UPI001C1F6147|nr:alpha/beta hydrolase [Ruegeria sp. EL01]
MQKDVRQYGGEPSRIAVLHGGPGGAGEVEPFARELGRRGYAVLEPFQTRRSVDGQVDELRSQIERHCIPPVAVIGWSWGAWLGCLLAARYPALVRTLILVGSGPFDAKYAEAIRTTKNSRLSQDERDELMALRPMEGEPEQIERFIELSDLADTFRRDTSIQPRVDLNIEIHETVWPEANEMRINGTLLKEVSSIRSPVTAIHGDYDPRPADGVRIPLRTALPAANFAKLPKCGHKPWQEIHAKERFFELIEVAIA